MNAFFDLVFADPFEQFQGGAQSKDAGESWAADLQRRSRLLQIQPIVYDTLRVADTPPPRNWEALGIQKTRADVETTYAVPSLRPLVSAENQKVDTAGDRIDRKHAHPLRCIYDKNQVAF